MIRKKKQNLIQIQHKSNIKRGNAMKVVLKNYFCKI